MTPWVVFSAKCRVCQGLAVWRPYLGLGHSAVTHPSLKAFPSVCQREQKQNALTQPSPWHLHDAKMVTWSPPTNQLRLKRRGWWRLALHLSCTSLTQQTTDPPWRTIKTRSYEWGILILKRLFSSTVTFWQHLGELVPKSNYRLLWVRRDGGYSSWAKPKQWPPELPAFKAKPIYQ